MGGQDKGRLLVDGRPIILWQLDVLRQLTREIIVIAPRAERFADLGLTVHADCVPDAGTMGGVYTALTMATASRVVVVGCDMPFLQLALLEALVARTEGCDGAWVRSSRGVEPLLACYDRRAREAIGRQVANRALAMHELGSVLNLAEIGPEDLLRYGSPDDLLTNINTPADYARVQYRRA